MKIDGSGWSKLTVFIALKRARSYLYGYAVAVPRDDVERRVAVARRPTGAPPDFTTTCVGRVVVLEGRHRREEVARVREAVGADGPQLGQAQAPRRSSRRRSRAPARRASRGTSRRAARRRSRRVPRRGARTPCRARAPPPAARGAARRRGRRTRRSIDRLAAYRCTPIPACRRASPLVASVTRPSTKSVGLLRHRRAAPSAAGSGRTRPRGRAPCAPARLDAAERRMHRARPQPVEPRAQVLRARRRERGDRELLRVEPEGRLLRRVLPARQRPRDGLRLVVRPEPRHVPKFACPHGCHDPLMNNPCSSVFIRVRSLWVASLSTVKPLPSRSGPPRSTRTAPGNCPPRTPRSPCAG